MAKEEIVGFSRPFHAKREADLAKGLAAYLGMTHCRVLLGGKLYWLRAKATLSQVGTFAAMEARRQMSQEKKAEARQ